jgi:hydrogenase expression/formation protein HypC
VGTWVITFLDAEREVIDEDQALQVSKALEAVSIAMGSDGTAGIEDLFADIIERGPQLPPHLQAEVNKE